MSFEVQLVSKIGVYCGDFGDTTSRHCGRDVIVAIEEALVLPESFGFT